MAAAAKLRRLARLSLADCSQLPGVCLAELTPLARQADSVAIADVESHLLAA